MKLENLKINCLGASNTQISISTDRIKSKEINYPYFLERFLGCTVRNYGVSGTNITKSQTRSDSYFERADLMERDADIIIIQGDGNDANHNIPLGRVGECDCESYCGAILSLIEKVRRDFPQSKILMLGGTRKAKIKRTCDSLTHEDFHAAFLESCSYAGADVLSFFEDEYFDCNDPHVFPDGTHMTEETCRCYGEKVATKVKNMFEIN